MDLSTFIITYYKYIISAAISAVFLVVNIIQAIKKKNIARLKDALEMLPEVIRQVEDLSSIKSLTAIEKKAAAESILYSRLNSRFVDKHIAVFDAAIEDILNTPAKKGGSYVQKENEER